MRIAFTVMFFALSASTSFALDCSGSQQTAGNLGKLLIASDDLFGANPLFPNGRQFCEKSESLQATYVSPMETGEISGATYLVNRNNLEAEVDTGNGETWSIFCRKDAMDDSHFCSIMKGDISISRSSHNGALVRVVCGKNCLDRSPISIRVDDGSVFRGRYREGFAKGQIDDLMAALLSGSSALSRYENWTTGFNQDTRISLHGIGAAVLLRDQMFESLNHN